MIITPFAYMATKETGWTPADFTNVQYWWRADLGVTESGGSVTVWEDQINAYQLVNSGTPTKTTEAGLNGADVIDFNGSSDYLYATSTPAARTGDFTILGVYYTDVVQNDTIFGISNLPAQLKTQFQLAHSSGNTLWVSRKFGAAGSFGVLLESPGTTGAQAVKGRYDASAGDEFGALNSLIEIPGGTTGNLNQGWDSGVTFAAGAWVSGTGGGVYDSRYFNGKVAEMVMIYGSPSTLELNEWMAYVNAKYGTIIEPLPPAVVAYSIRKLYNAYAGSAIQVRRSGDNATQDIGFDSNGDLDTATMEAFVVAGGGTQDGYVTTWYDQSGNGNDQTQATAGNQPQIVSSGTTITQGGKPTLQFSNSYFSRTNVISNTADKTTFNVYYPTNVAVSDCIMELSSVTPAVGQFWTLTSETALRCNSRTYVTTAGVSNTYSLLEMWQDGITIDNAAQFKMYLNGTYEARTSGAAGNLVTATGDFYIGYSPNNGANYFDGNQQEVIIFNSALADSAREEIRDNINTYFSVYP